MPRASPPRQPQARKIRAAPRAPAEEKAEGRREAILDAALEEFSSRGYGAASTNSIAARAKVAKGLVFHYFDSKDDLYLALLDRTLAALIEEFLRGIEPSPRDLFERIHRWTEVRLRMVRARPEYLRLFTDALINTPPALLSKIRERLAPLEREMWGRLMEGIDLGLLRPGVTAAQALELLMLLQVGLERKYLSQLAASPPSLEAMTQEAVSYIDLLRDGLYRRE